MAGNTSSDRATSLNWNKRHTAMSVANVRPTGQMRQNTGNPNTAVDSSAPPSTQLRESAAPPRWAAGTSSASEARRVRFGSFKPKIRLSRGIGQPQAQNARPNNTTSAMPTASAMSIGGTTILLASVASAAPSGQMAAMS